MSKEKEREREEGESEREKKKKKNNKKKKKNDLLPHSSPCSFFCSCVSYFGLTHPPRHNDPKETKELPRTPTSCLEVSISLSLEDHWRGLLARGNMAVK